MKSFDPHRHCSMAFMRFYFEITFVGSCILESCQFYQLTFSFRDIMVKLTPDLVSEAAQYTNAIKDRELDLRGYKIPLIENLGATLDQFDTIDFSENEIHKLDGFPVLKRLKALVFNSNKIVRIADGLEHSIPNLDTLILANNQLQELSDIDHLSSLKNLEFLVLTKNPVAMKPNYRLYVIHRLPRVRFLDYK